MKFSSGSLIAAALLFLPAASSVDTMPAYNCSPIDTECIDQYNAAMSSWANNVDAEYSDAASNCNDISPQWSQEARDCYAGIGNLWNTANNSTAVDDADVITTTTDPSSMSVVPGASGAVSSPFKDMTVVSSSSAASTTTSLAAAISLVTAATATVMVVA